MPGVLSTLTPLRAARPERGRTCASVPAGSAIAMPVGIIALYVIWHLLPNVKHPEATHQYDIAGGLVFIVGIAMLLIGLTNKQSADWADPSVGGLIGAITADPAMRRKAAADLFDVVAKGVVNIEIGQTFALKDVGQAHVALASRKTSGSTVLIP